jgi:hypothetical protein
MRTRTDFVQSEAPQMLTVWSNDPVSSKSPVWLNETQMISELCPERVPIWAPVSKSHSFAVLHTCTGQPNQPKDKEQNTT